MKFTVEEIARVIDGKVEGNPGPGGRRSGSGPGRRAFHSGNSLCAGPVPDAAG